ncbi:PRC-barrel domain-containing protein [Halobaculum sp. EA56]|uniref:PRC-barrel domain-containing protein n=1 Tax=Halobaculum sp. EA56 TaxID=3421648 RepID=UPI003EBAB897
MPSEPVPVTALADKEVYTADGARVGRVTDVVVDLDGETPVELALSDVAEGTVGGLPSGAAGVRVPFRLVRGVNDVVVLRAAASEAALPLPGSRDDGPAASDEAGPAGAPPSSEGGPSETDDGDPIV